MATELPYLNSYKNVGKLFDKIGAAAKPEAFTHRFLTDTLGLKSATTDRPLIPLLRTLGFIDSAGKPTADYNLLKNPAKRGAAIATAIRKAYKPLFDANENAHNLSGAELRGVIAQVAGTDGSMTSKIAGTFNALAKSADFSGDGVADAREETKKDDNGKGEKKDSITKSGLRPEFHYNFQVHLPSNGTEETYLNIFNALRKVFQ